MCGNPAPTKEHVPPTCLFPEEDVAGKDYRINLITVRSCPEHNLKKSDNDAYLMAVIAWHAENNEIAHLQADKILRASKTNPRISQFLKTLGKRIVNGVWVDSLQFDREIVKIEIEHIARALYFREFRKKYTSLLAVGISSAVFSETSSKDFLNNLQLKELRSMVNGHTEKFLKKGSNPEVFYYQMNRDEETGRWLLRMVFYEGFEVFVMSTTREIHD